MKIVTHDGPAHADDIFACAVLSAVHKANIVRTRDLKELDTIDNIFVDVGMEYNGVNRFDHHQKNALCRTDGQTYSSFGLVWKHFGIDFLKTVRINYLEEVWKKVDETLVYRIDRADNGDFFPDFGDISSMLQHNNDGGDFLLFMTFAGTVLVGYARSIDEKIRQEREVLPRVVVEDSIAFSQEYIDPELLNRSIKALIYRTNDGKYAARSVSKPLPIRYAGCLPEELPDDLEFVHKNRFFAVARSATTLVKLIKDTL